MKSQNWIAVVFGVFLIAGTCGVVFAVKGSYEQNSRPELEPAPAPALVEDFSQKGWTRLVSYRIVRDTVTGRRYLVATTGHGVAVCLMAENSAVEEVKP